ncbi:TetR/AcrR family transcriptional regulator [Streptodolium elevatio]|uniref:Helix-turn-helix domain-containing protein n=1 Tax=Streptodolium elevatio TaxID=3157996 RepID=A0ABV3DS83_9ACTN
MAKTGRTATPAGQRADARLNRERIVAAAREVFAEDGPDASLNEIARRAGVGPGTLYRHFPNRRALAAAVVVERVEILVAHADRLLATDVTDVTDAAHARGSVHAPDAAHVAAHAGAADPAAAAAAAAADAALVEWFRAFLAHARLHQGTAVAAMAEESADGEADGLGVDCHRLITDAAAALLARAQRTGAARPDVASDDLVQLVVGIALSAGLGGDDEQPERLLALVLDGVRGR